jgi:hypothetical protein
MSDDKVTIGGALGYAWSLWTQNWRSIWGVLAFYAVSVTIFEAGQLAHDPSLLLAGAVATGIASLSTYGAVFRIAFAKETGDRAEFKPGALGLQWRGAEWRMLAASLLQTLFFVMVGMIVLVAECAVVAGMLMAKGVPLAQQQSSAQVLAALGPTGTLVANALALVLAAVLAFFYFRLFLALVASAVTGKIQVLKTWSLTKGRFWAILATVLVIQLPAILLSFAIVGLGDFTRTPAPPATAFSIALVVGILTGAVLGPMVAGAMAYFYKHPRAPA